MLYVSILVSIGTIVWLSFRWRTEETEEGMMEGREATTMATDTYVIARRSTWIHWRVLTKGLFSPSPV